MNRDFKGIWIPKDIWLDSNLTMQEKVFIVEIESLDNEKGCFASNRYFAEFFQISTVRVSQVINSLIKKGHINRTITYRKGSKEILNRVLKLSIGASPRNVYDPPLEKLNTPPLGMFKDNNTVKNNIINNTTIKGDFEKFWIAYDKKEGRKDCFNKYTTLYKKGILPDIETHVMIIESWKRTDKWKEGFKPNPKTWLNGQRWEDELPLIKKTDKELIAEAFEKEAIRRGDK